jgi:putative endonuclease
MSNFKRTVLYIGVSNNLIRRIIEHKYGLGSVFTRKYKLKHLIYYEEYQYIKDAIQREKELKGWVREKKVNLIKSENPKVRDLSEKLLKEYSHREINEVVSELRNIYKN